MLCTSTTFHHDIMLTLRVDFVWCPNDNDNDYVNNVSNYCITTIVFLLAYIYFVYFAAYPEIWVGLPKH